MCLNKYIILTLVMLSGFMPIFSMNDITSGQKATENTAYATESYTLEPHALLAPQYTLIYEENFIKATETFSKKPTLYKKFKARVLDAKITHFTPMYKTVAFVSLENNDFFVFDIPTQKRLFSRSFGVKVVKTWSLNNLFFVSLENNDLRIFETNTNNRVTCKNFDCPIKDILQLENLSIVRLTNNMVYVLDLNNNAVELFCKQMGPIALSFKIRNSLFFFLKNLQGYMFDLSQKDIQGPAISLKFNSEPHCIKQVKTGLTVLTKSGSLYLLEFKKEGKLFQYQLNSTDTEFYSEIINNFLYIEGINTNRVYLIDLQKAGSEGIVFKKKFTSPIIYKKIHKGVISLYFKNNVFYVFDIKTGKTLLRQKLPSKIACTEGQRQHLTLSFSNSTKAPYEKDSYTAGNGKYITFGLQNNEIYVFDPANPKKKLIFKYSFSHAIKAIKKLAPSKFSIKLENNTLCMLNIKKKEITTYNFDSPPTLIQCDPGFLYVFLKKGTCAIFKINSKEMIFEKHFKEAINLSSKHQSPRAVTKNNHVLIYFNQHKKLYAFDLKTKAKKQTFTHTLEDAAEFIDITGTYANVILSNKTLYRFNLRNGNQRFCKQFEKNIVYAGGVGNIVHVCFEDNEVCIFDQNKVEQENLLFQQTFESPVIGTMNNRTHSILFFFNRTLRIFDLATKKELYQGNEITQIIKEEKEAQFNQSLIHFAIILNDLKLLKYLVQECKQDVNAAGEREETPVLVATFYGSDILLKYLLEHGARVDASEKQGGTPLMLAAYAGDIKTVKLLVSEGAKTNLRNKKENLSAIDIAFIENNKDVFLYLLEESHNTMSRKDFEKLVHKSMISIRKGERIDSKLIMLQAILQKEQALLERTNTTKPLIGKKQIIELIDIASQENLLKEATFLVMQNKKLLYNLLEHFIKEKDHKAVEFLVDDCGIAVNTTIDTLGQTMIHIAAEYGDLQIVTYLKEKGAAYDQPNRKGETPLHIASNRGNDIVADYLLTQRANIKAKDNKGRTPLHHATLGGHYSTVLFLIETYRATVEKEDKWGNTALYYAASQQNKDITRYLIEKKASIYKKGNNGKGKTPIELYPEILKFPIVKKYAQLHENVLAGNWQEVIKAPRSLDINYKYANEETLVHMAFDIGQNRERMLEVLIKKCNAKVNRKRNDGATAFHALINSDMVLETKKKFARLLKSKGGDPTETDNGGVSAITMAQNINAPIHQFLVNEL